MKAKYAREAAAVVQPDPPVVEAAYRLCPTRTLWDRQADGTYLCRCCGRERSTLDALVGAVTVNERRTR